MKWTLDTALESAKRFNTRSEWKLGCPSYQWAFKKAREHIPTLTNHMRPPVDLRGRSWCVYVYEFDDESVYVGLTHDVDKRRIGHAQNGPVFEKSKHSTHTFTIIERDLVPMRAVSLEQSQIATYTARGWTVLNRSSGGELGSIRRTTFDQCLSSAREASSRTEWGKISYAHYQVALRNGWVDQIASACGWPKHKGHRWTKDTLLDSASRYTSRSAWAKGHSAAYGASIRHGLLDEIAIELGWPEYKTQSKAVFVDTSANVGSRAVAVVGIPASGKSWVLSQLNQLHTVHYDKLSMPSRLSAMHKIAARGDVPVIDPFTAISFIRRNAAYSFDVYAILEDESVIRERRQSRRSSNTAIPGIRAEQRRFQRRVVPHACFVGTSSEVLEELRIKGF